MSYRAIGCWALLATFSCAHTHPASNHRAIAIAIAVLDNSTVAMGRAAAAFGHRVVDDLDREVTQRPGLYLATMEGDPIQGGLAIQRCQGACPALVRDSLQYSKCASGCELDAANNPTTDYLLVADVLAIGSDMISLGLRLIDVQRGALVARASEDCAGEALDAAIARMAGSLMNNLGNR